MIIQHSTCATTPINSRSSSSSKQQQAASSKVQRYYYAYIFYHLYSTALQQRESELFEYTFPFKTTPFIFHQPLSAPPSFFSQDGGGRHADGVAGCFLGGVNTNSPSLPSRPLRSSFCSHTTTGMSLVGCDQRYLTKKPTTTHPSPLVGPGHSQTGWRMVGDRWRGVGEEKGVRAGRWKRCG